MLRFQACPSAPVLLGTAVLAYWCWGPCGNQSARQTLSNNSSGRLMDKWTSGGTNFFCSRSSPLCHDAILCGLWYPDSPESTGIGAWASAAPSRLPGSIIGCCRRICHRKGTTYKAQARNRRIKLFLGSKCFNKIQNEAGRDGRDALIYKAGRIGTDLIFFSIFFWFIGVLMGKCPPDVGGFPHDGAYPYLIARHISPPPPVAHADQTLPTQSHFITHSIHPT